MIRKFKISNLKFKILPRNGFSLIELIIYMGILLVMIYVLTDILYSTLNSQLETQSSSGIAQDGRYLYSRLTYDINRAQAVSAPQNLGDTSNTLQVTIGGLTYTYALVGGNLTITDNTGTYVLNGPDTSISGLTFKRIGNTGGKDTFQINYSVTSNIIVNGKNETEAFQTTAGLR